MKAIQSGGVIDREGIDAWLISGKLPGVPDARLSHSAGVVSVLFDPAVSFGSGKHDWGKSRLFTYEHLSQSVDTVLKNYCEKYAGRTFSRPQMAADYEITDSKKILNFTRQAEAVLDTEVSFNHVRGNPTCDITGLRFNALVNIPPVPFSEGKVYWAKYSQPVFNALLQEKKIMLDDVSVILLTSSWQKGGHEQLIYGGNIYSDNSRVLIDNPLTSRVEGAIKCAQEMKHFVEGHTPLLQEVAEMMVCARNVQDKASSLRQGWEQFNSKYNVCLKDISNVEKLSEVVPGMVQLEQKLSTVLDQATEKLQPLYAGFPREILQYVVKS